MVKRYVSVNNELAIGAPLASCEFLIDNLAVVCSHLPPPGSFSPSRMYDGRIVNANFHTSTVQVGMYLKTKAVHLYTVYDFYHASDRFFYRLIFYVILSM